MMVQLLGMYILSCVLVETPFDYVTKTKIVGKYLNMSSIFHFSLQAYKHLAPLRLLVCGGDGSVGWVLKEIDKLHMKVS